MSAPLPTLAAALQVVSPYLVDLLGAAKDNFRAAYGEWVASEHRDLLDERFLAAGHAKLAILAAATPEEAQQREEEYEARLASLDTLGLDVRVVGKAEARLAIRSTAHQVLSTLAAVAGALVKFALAAAVPGVGNVVGALAGAGIERILEAFASKLG